LREACDFEVTEYRLDWLYRTHIERVLAERLEAGEHSMRVRHRHGTRLAMLRANGS
jgi:hypothetical protein